MSPETAAGARGDTACGDTACGDTACGDTACEGWFADLAAWVGRQPPRLGPVRLVAVDGPAGSGKTTFAARLVEALAELGLTVAQVHTDDLLDGWDDALTFWPRLRAWVLDPLAQGRPGAYRRYNWHAGEFRTDWTPVPVPDVLVLEGVSVARRSVRHEVSLSVLLVADEETRLARGLRRDGEHLRPQWLRWMAAEARHFAADRIDTAADLIVDGAADLVAGGVDTAADPVAHSADTAADPVAHSVDTEADVVADGGGGRAGPTGDTRAAFRVLADRRGDRAAGRDTVPPSLVASTSPATPAVPTSAAMAAAVRSSPGVPQRPAAAPAYDPEMASTLTEQDLRAAVERELPGVRADLERLVRIPGIAFDGFDHSVLERSAEAVVELLRGAGLPDVRIVRADGQPAVIGRRPAPPGAPTVLLYAHHDVQPIGDAAQWQSQPFEPQERDGRLYGRGAADDKAGILAHVAALRALGDDLPVGVVVFVEGEEEFGSQSLETLLERYRADLAADVIVIGDSGSWQVGVPALTTHLRGIVNAFVEVSTLDHAIHSGMFGGPVPDALTTLCRLLGTLHDEAGDVAIKGLAHGQSSPLDLPVGRLRAEAGMLDGVELIGTGRIVDRLWAKPALSVIGIDAPRTGEAPNALIPTAKAKLSLRIAAGDNWRQAYEALAAHLESHAPWGARVTVTPEHGGDPCVIGTDGPAFDVAREAFRVAWDGTALVEMGVGGSIPFIATFQEMFPEASILVIGPEDPDSRAHGPNESLHLGEFARLCLAETLLLAGLKPHPA